MKFWYLQIHYQVCNLLFELTFFVPKILGSVGKDSDKNCFLIGCQWFHMEALYPLFMDFSVK